MRALITGGAGFIGSHLAEALLAEGEEVTIIDDLSTGRLDNVQHLVDNPRFRYVIESVLNETVMDPLVSDCDIIYHLAAAVGVEMVVDEPLQTLQTNLLGTEMVLRLADRHHKKVLLSSTSEVYGKNEKVPFKEEDDILLGPTTRIRWCYAASKAVDEFLALAYHRERGLPVVIVRLFNTVGPRQTGRYGMVIPRFVRQALAGEPITVYGDGQQTRCFADVAGHHRSGPASRGCGPGVQHRQHGGDRHPGAGPAGEETDGQQLGNRLRALRAGLRGRIRGHAAAGAGLEQDFQPDRLPATVQPGRDTATGD